jgi:DNA gyrase/topoisomerase IV subunit A
LTDDEIRRQEGFRRSMLSALSRVLNDPLPFVEIMSTSVDDAAARERLRSKYGFDSLQVEACLDAQFRRLTAFDRARIEDELRSSELGGLSAGGEAPSPYDEER